MCLGLGPVLVVMLVGLGQARVPLHSMMTEEEFKFYFGDQTEAEIEETYSLGMIKKMEEGGVEEARTRSNLEEVLSAEGEMWTFEAFNLKKMLNLKNNNLLISDRANIGWVVEGGEEVRTNVNTSKLSCHKIHRSEDLVAAVSHCGKSRMTGFVSMPEDTFEFSPLTKDLKNKVKAEIATLFRTPLEFEALIMDDFYFVKRVTFPNFTGSDAEELQWDDTEEEEEEHDYLLEFPLEELEVGAEGQQNKMIETAVFFDHIAYNRFSAIYDDEEIVDHILAYVNQVAAIYRMPSLGQQIDIMITYLEIQKEEGKFDNKDGERIGMLTSFCEYSNSKNHDEDSTNPRHWDVGVLVSGLDIWTENNGVRAYKTLGLARTRGMCVHSPRPFSCLVVEFGVISALGSSYPTTGFSAAYTLAHELGHNLGMSHDKDSCTISGGSIMAKSRTATGQTLWSPCSGESIRNNEHKLDKCLNDRQIMSQWDHNSHFELVPGYFYSAKEQCRFFFKGAKGADVGSSEDNVDICQNLVCQKGSEKGEDTGPPLEGTACGGQGTHWCRGGSCVPLQSSSWSLWRSAPCTSACTRGGSGARERVRTCLTLPGYQEAGCGEDGRQGLQARIDLCQDSALCGARTTGGRRTRAQLATLLCEQQVPFLPALERKVRASLAPHSPSEPWQACALYCSRADGEGWIHPEGETFPDGTWCHTEGDQELYCRGGLCQPADSKEPK